MKFLKTHGQLIQTLAALLTPILALVALVGVHWQIQANQKQAETTFAREIYRSLVAISLERPELTKPGRCRQFTTQDATQYYEYIEYLLYTAEQVVQIAPEWEGVFAERLGDHPDLFCRPENWSQYSPAVQRLISDFQNQNCPQLLPCSGAEN